MRIAAKPVFSLIFVNYRSADALAASLASLADEVVGGYAEMIVVNNDPSERASLSRLADQFPIRIVDLGENVGFGAASNRGAREAGAELLGFLNPDTRLVRGSLREVAGYFDGDDRAGIAGAALVDPDGKPEPWSAGPDATLFRIFVNNLSLFRGAPPRDGTPTAVDFVSGAAFFTRKSLFDKLGGFDERFFLYFEDMDLCRRAGIAGYDTVRLPAPVFAHEGGTSRSSAAEQKRHYYESQDRYFGKHRPKWEGGVLKFLRRRFIR